MTQMAVPPRAIEAIAAYWPCGAKRLLNGRWWVTGGRARDPPVDTRAREALCSPIAEPKNDMK
ncbi:hypothetical protein [Catenulispora rubra]|uniref:hypothetical protein n=1 Tax=Catenulispora rubra TaxID=280293 RepID=UPI0018928063|nr:hypothetical protein [Catenulispora rubra]